MSLRSIILVSSFFSCQDAFDDTHDDPNGPTSQFDLGHGQSHHSAIDIITLGVTPLKWAVLPESCQFSENVHLHRTLIRKNAGVKMLNVFPMHKDRNKRHFWYFINVSFTFSVALRYAIKRTLRHLKIQMAKGVNFSKCLWVPDPYPAPPPEL